MKMYKDNVTQRRQCNLLIYSCFHCFVYATYCVYQFYESCNGAIVKRSSEVGIRKVLGAERKLLDHAISW